MMSSKRKHEAITCIDLTGSDNETDAPPVKTPKKSQSRDTWYQSAPDHSLADRNAWLADDDEDIYEVVASTQDAAIGSEDLLEYGQLLSKVVGVQYYHGFATKGERILLRREPGNPYDGNAIRIDNMRGEQIGHIPKTKAAKLAKYIDSRWLLMEGALAGEIGPYDCPLIVHMFGPPLGSAQSNDLVRRMKDDKLPLHGVQLKEKEEKKRLTEERKRAASTRPSSSQSQFTSSPTNGAGMDQTMLEVFEACERFNPRNISQAAEQYGTSEANLAAMPQAKQPKRIITPMLPYQLQALHWLLEKETPQLPPPGSDDYIQLWRRHATDSRAFTNVATNFSIKDQQPVLASGGILADDMGLGKTLEMISLMVTDMSTFKKSRPDEPHATLIVSPVSVMSNWRDQVSCFCSHGQHLHANDDDRSLVMLSKTSLCGFTPTTPQAVSPCRLKSLERMTWS